MAKRKPKEPERACAFCNATEVFTEVPLSPWLLSYDASGKAASATFQPRSYQQSNLKTIARGLIACGACAKIHNEGSRGRARNIRALKDKPITSPEWGKFLESRK